MVINYYHSKTLNHTTPNLKSYLYHFPSQKILLIIVSYFKFLLFFYIHRLIFTLFKFLNKL